VKCDVTLDERYEISVAFLHLHSFGPNKPHKCSSMHLNITKAPTDQSGDSCMGTIYPIQPVAAQQANIAAQTHTYI
jgi:hypothetical protein